jgi:dipeptidyl aminopeptidase/acylaminoacyl peptidase
LNPKKEITLFEKTNNHFESEGEKINYILYRPAGRKTFSSILFHPGNKVIPEDYDWLNEGLALNGYLVMAIAQRGYGSGKRCVNDRAGAIQQKDLSNALSILKKIEGADKDRIGAIGHSNGAGLSLRLAAYTKDVKCVVALSMVSDWAEFVRRAEEYLPDYYKLICEEFGGSPSQNPEAYQIRSCLHLADKIRVPVYIIVGAEDTTTPAYLSKWMYDALKNCGNNNVDFLILEEAGHFYENSSFSGYKTQEVQELVLKWLKMNL